ncbi:GNAT family N-acetyltransferase [Pseudonocardia sp. McavD-2-B]|uniref:GNAT family N-acetyltransferase n=1 Tax=Pseudonocardia sp. McavD-2-B TaxID=2954499 RepID=UPI002097F2C0|nr:GNAT family N-acetyltransferase [Pseudonocardia sp. McavD-2-B]MCO7193637.1 GNAT family N-acetyltransferase [Pseudonocardia sp. McavD-2-B]
MTEPERTVRERQDGDLAVLAAVLKRVHAHDGYPVEGVADPRAWLEHPHEIQSWTALVDDVPVGQVTLTEAHSEDDAARAWIERTGGTVTDIAVMARLFLDPDHRGAGLAGFLILALRHHAQLIGRTVVFDVMAKDTAAIHLYDRFGAEQIAEVTHRFGDGHAEPALVYAFPVPRLAG